MSAIEMLLEEACQIELKLRESEELLEAVYSSLRYHGVLLKIDYQMLKKSNISIREWYSRRV